MPSSVALSASPMASLSSISSMNHSMGMMNYSMGNYSIGLRNHSVGQMNHSMGMMNHSMGARNHSMPYSMLPSRMMTHMPQSSQAFSGKGKRCFCGGPSSVQYIPRKEPSSSIHPSRAKSSRIVLSSSSVLEPQQRNITEINKDNGFIVRSAIAIQSVMKPIGSEIQYKSASSSWTTIATATKANSPVIPAESNMRFVWCF